MELGTYPDCKNPTGGTMGEERQFFELQPYLQVFKTEILSGRFPICQQGQQWRECRWIIAVSFTTRGFGGKWLAVCTKFLKRTGSGRKRFLMLSLCRKLGSSWWLGVSRQKTQKLADNQVSDLPPWRQKRSGGELLHHPTLKNHKADEVVQEKCEKDDWNLKKREKEKNTNPQACRDHNTIT